MEALHLYSPGFREDDEIEQDEYVIRIKKLQLVVERLLHDNLNGKADDAMRECIKDIAEYESDPEALKRHLEYIYLVDGRVEAAWGAVIDEVYNGQDEQSDTGATNLEQ